MSTQHTVQRIETSSLLAGLQFFSELFPGKIAFSTSFGQEDQVITDAIFRNDIPIDIFSIDTGRLFNETYELIEKTEARYGKKIKIYFPEATDVEEYVTNNGINGFYGSVDNRKLCCDIRKVRPLNRALCTVKMWVTGLRAQQSMNRQQMEVIEWNADRQLYKYNPLLQWTFEQMMNYIEEYNVPYNTLHAKGFFSIGCAPCTRAIEPGEDPRAGRWWWELSKKECGLHR